MSSLTGGIPTAGDNYTLECNITRSPHLDTSTELEVQWLDNSNNTITSGSSFTLRGDSTTTEPTLTSTLTINPVKTSHAGVYQCVARLTIPGIVQGHQVSASVQVRVKSESMH